MKQTASGFISILTGKVGTIVLGVLTTPIIVRILGSGQYGDYAFVLSIMSVSTIFVRGGISEGIRKYIAEDRNVEYWQEYVFSFYFRLGLLLASIGLIVLTILGLFAQNSHYFGKNYSSYLFLVGVILTVNQVFYISRFTLMGLHFERYSEPLLVLKKITFALVGIPLAYLGYNVAGLLVGLAVGSLVSAVIALWILHGEINTSAVVQSLPKSFPSRDLISFNILNTVLILFTVSLYHVDILMLRPIAGSQQTGLYRAALNVAEFAWLIPTAIQTVFIHSSSKLWSDGKNEEITEMASKATRYNILFTALVLIGIAALADDFVGLYFGSEFTAAVLPLYLLLPGVLGFAIARPIYAIGQGKGDLSILILATGAASLVNVFGNAILIPRYEIAGAAIATSIGYGSMLLFHSIVAYRIGYNPFSDLRLGRILFTVILVSPIVFELPTRIESSILTILLVPPIGFLIYVTISIWVGAIDISEIDPLVDRIPHPISNIASKVIHYLG